MALESLGLGAILTADSSKMVAGLNAARTAWNSLNTSVDATPGKMQSADAATASLAARMSKFATTMGSSARQMMSGVNSLALGMAPLGLALGYGVNKAANFERQMDAVGAVTLANTEEMKAMSDEARRMGIISVFSATQAGEGLELLARAGATPKQAIIGLSGVMNAAAADAIDMKTSADIIAQVINGMGLGYEKTAHVADVLALTSAKSNTDIIQLGESFKYGVAMSKFLGVGLEETAAIMGKLSDAGLKGSIAGTSYTNMLNKLADPSKRATALLTKWEIKLEKGGKLRPIIDIVADVAAGLEKLPGPMSRAMAASEIFGMRGMKAYGALATIGVEKTKALQVANEKSSEGIGAATEMANRRLENLPGRIRLFLAAMEGIFIGLFGPIIEIVTKSLEHLTGGVRQVLFAFQAMMDLTKANALNLASLSTLEAKYGKNTVAMARGILDVVNWMGRSWDWLKQKVTDFGNTLSDKLGPEGLRSLVRIAGQILVVGGLISPILVQIAILGFLFSGLATIAESAFTMIGAVLGLIGWEAIAIALGGFLVLRKEGESLGQTFSRVWGDIKAWALDVYNNGILPFGRGLSSFLSPALEDLGGTIDVLTRSVKSAFDDMFGNFNVGSKLLGEGWETVGQVIIFTLTYVLRIAIKIVASIITAFFAIINPAMQCIKLVYKLMDALAAIAEGKLGEGFKRLGLAIVDIIAIPFQWLFKLILALGDIFGMEESTMKEMRKFADTGFTGMVFPEEKEKAKAKKDADEGWRHRYGKVASEEELAAMGVGAAGVGQKVSAGDTWYASQLALQEQARLAEEQRKLDEKMGLNDAINKLANKKLEANIESKLCVDGDVMAGAVGRSNSKVKERSGGMPAWQRSMIFDYGTARGGG